MGVGWGGRNVVVVERVIGGGGTLVEMELRDGERTVGVVVWLG